MDIENVWKQSKGNDDSLNLILQNDDFTKFHSRLPLQRLKKNLSISMVWAVLITAAYIAVFFFIHTWQVYVALSVMIIFNLWTMYESKKLYYQMPSGITIANSLKAELTKNYNAFQQWLSLQLKVSVLVFPVATAGGFILGGVLRTGKSVEAFLYNPRMLTFLVITVIVFIPLSYFLTKWMFNHAYGKHLKKMKGLIEELNQL